MTEIVRRPLTYAALMDWFYDLPTDVRARGYIELTPTDYFRVCAWAESQMVHLDDETEPIDDGGWPTLLGTEIRAVKGANPYHFARVENGS